MNERDVKPAPSQPLVDWLNQQYDMPQRDHSGPEAMAWDAHGLQVAAHQPHVAEAQA
jgi:hypothetical protein